jgi:glutamate synthase domain-containing protein 2
MEVFWIPPWDGIARNVFNHRRKESGGRTTPCHILKGMALGADAVYIGSIALLAGGEGEKNILVHATNRDGSP